MKSRWLAIPLTAVGMTLLSAGCQAPGPPTGPTVADVTAQTPDEYERLFDAVAGALRSRYFRLDRIDRRQGVVTTHRETSASGFEFWRPQPQPAYYWAESNLHTIQRQAAVHIRPTDEQGAYEIDVQVDRYRYSLDERQVDNAAGALRIFSSDAPTYAGRTLYSTAAEASPDGYEKLEETSSWIHLGRDPPMERVLLGAILRRYGAQQNR